MRKTILPTAFVCLIIGIAFILYHLAAPKPAGSKVKTNETMITKGKAIEIAKAAIKDKKLQEGAPITVELHGSEYIVTFGYIRPNPKEHPGWRGPDFMFKVTLDAYTGSLKNGIQCGR